MTTFPLDFSRAEDTIEWPMQVRQIHYISSADATSQPAMFYAPKTENPCPLLVALHTWSHDYTQKNIPYAEWCIDKNWVLIHPDFRGPNKNPQATGSVQVVKDIISAVDYAKAHANIDTSRIYLVGESGGGYTALLMAGRCPDIWAGVSAWASITDLKQWYIQCKKTGRKYADDIVNSCGGIPGQSLAVDFEYKNRSPVTYLQNAVGLPLDINAGIMDGHTGSVPIDHSLRAFNVLVAERERISENNIKYFVEKAEVPSHLKMTVKDPTYGQNQPLFRRISGKTRITIFDGSHEIIYKAALTWLEKQKKQT